jgi:hypothetical protein
MTDTYQDLSDSEWLSIEPTVGDAIATNRKSPRGRPRMDSRPVINAIIKNISTATPIGAKVNSYPAASSKRRLLHLLVSTRKMPNIIELLAVGRPGLGDKYLAFMRKGGFKIPDDIAPSEGTWGIGFTALPWGPAGTANSDE